MSISNSNNYLKAARSIFINDVGEASDKMKEYRDARSGYLMTAFCNLICHAQAVVFEDGYNKKSARQFAEDVATECGLSEKQAFKYTSAITGGLGLRATKGQFKGGGIDGLPAAAMDGPEAVAKHLKLLPEPIETVNQFIAFLAVAKNEVAELAKKLAKFSPGQRKEAMDMATKMDAAGQKKAA